MRGNSPETCVKPKQSSSSKLERGLFVIAGTVSLGLGAIGVILPVLPTTPFLLLSAACYYKSSERMHRWMLNNRWFGSYLKSYNEGKGIPLKTKAFTVAVLWAAIGYTALIHVNVLILQIILFIIALAVTAHIVKLPTLKDVRL